MHHSRASGKLIWIFFFAVLTQRFGLPVAGTVPLALPLYLLAAIFLYVRGEVTIRQSMLLAILVIIGLLIGTNVLTGNDFSVSSMLYLFILYLPLCLVPTGEPIALAENRGFRLFSTMMCGFACIAIAQYASQVILNMTYSDPLLAVPEAFRLTNYEITYPIKYGSPTYKSNAYLFLEPSFLSQFLGLALLLEIIVFRRFIAIALQIGALACTFSGTGILLLVLTMPFVIAANLRDKRVIAIACVAGAIVVGAVVSNPDVLDRAKELDSQQSSASIRFSTPYQRLRELSFATGSSWLIGYGAGSADRMKVDDQLANYPAIPKALIEYGLIGGLPLLLFLVVRIFSGIRNLPVAVALFCMQFFLSGALLQPLSLFLLFYFICFGDLRRSRAVHAVDTQPVHV